MRARVAVVTLIAATLLYVLWPAAEPDDSALDGGDPELLADRVWLEAMPTSRTQHVHVLYVLADAPYGVFQRASAYQATLEVFEYIRDRAKLDLRFPQSGKKADVRVRARSCSDHPPFDLCLDLAKNPWGGPTHYYGFRDTDTAPEVVRELGHRLEHAAIDGP
jgi:hypothetical protein